jgi:hypothetical protein
MANKSGGASKVGQAATYKSQKLWERNRTRRLKKLMVLQPNNETLVKALANIHYRRKTPTTPFWSSSRIQQARLFKMFCGRVDMDMFSNNEKVSGPALLTPGPYSKLRFPNVPEKTMFQLGTRARFPGAAWNC